MGGWWHCVALLLPVRHLGFGSGSLPAGGGRAGRRARWTGGGVCGSHNGYSETFALL